MADLRFNHLECDNDGNIQMSVLTEAGRVRYVALSSRDFATLIKDA